MRRSSMIPVAVLSGVLGLAACGGGEQAGGEGAEAGYEVADPAAGGLDAGTGAGATGTTTTPGMGAPGPAAAPGAGGMTGTGATGMPMDSAQATPTTPQ